MQRVFMATTSFEAHLIHQLLERESIQASVFNEYAYGAVGELPINEVWPEVWIDDDRNFPAARIIIERYETTMNCEIALSCAECKEGSPRNFELCWNCGAALFGET